MFESDELFPTADCIAAFGEWSAWTSVPDIAAAARCLADAPALQDTFATRLVVRFPNDDTFQRILLDLFGWFVAGYRVPPQKVELAAEIDLCLTPERKEILKNVAFHPTVTIGTSEELQSAAPGAPVSSDDRFLLVEDRPHVIELVQSPLRCMCGCLRDAYSLAIRIQEIRRAGAEKRSKPMTILHRHYADSRVLAVLEAVCFHACGLQIGLAVAAPGPGHYDIAYKAINVFGRPPVELSLLAFLQEHAAQFMYRST